MINTSVLVKKSVIKAAFMIAGTAIGAGMLGIPLVTADIGLNAALLSTFCVWLYMLITGLFLMEVSISMREKGGFLNMAEKYLPRYGKTVTAALFIFLYGILLVAYISAGARILSLVAPGVGYLFPVLLALVLSLHSNKVISIISMLTIPMWIYFFIFYFMGASHIQMDRFSTAIYSQSYLAVPVLFGAFGYHNVIPSAAKYLQYDREKLRGAILLGSLIPCVVYVLWQVLILGMVDPATLANARTQGVPVVVLLNEVGGTKAFGNIGAMFAFFAIITSALGVGMSVVDFIDAKKKRLSVLLIILIPTLIAIVNPGIFLRALSFAGGFGESILNGIIPIWMYAVYQKNKNQMSQKLRICMFFLLLIAAFVVGIELSNLV